MFRRPVILVTWPPPACLDGRFLSWLLPQFQVVSRAVVQDDQGYSQQLPAAGRRPFRWQRCGTRILRAVPRAGRHPARGQMLRCAVTARACAAAQSGAAGRRAAALYEDPRHAAH